jgi:hypothetical protein
MPSPTYKNLKNYYNYDIIYIENERERKEIITMLPNFHFTIERWKYNPTFELYVSNMGHIRNKSKADIAPKVAPSGYLTIRVGGSINAYMLLHRVVMLTWKPTPEAENLTVDHLDHNKRNNALSNLEWVVKEENQRRAAIDLIKASEIVDHHLVETRIKSTKVIGYNLEFNGSQYPTLKGCGYYCADVSAIVAFLHTKKAEGCVALKWVGPKSEARLKSKFRGLLNGSNLTGKIQYMGMTITPVVKE